MANTFKFGNGNWAVKDGYALAYNDENNNFKPLPFDFTRASSATRVNKQGLVEVVPSGKPRIDFLDNTSGHLLLEPSRTNLLVRSEDLSTTWITSAASVTTNTHVSPDGNLTADTLTVTGSGGGIYQDNITVSAATQYTFTFYAKRGTIASDELALAIRNQSAGTFIDENIAYTASTDEWTRIERTFTTPSGCTSVRVYPQRKSGGGQGTIFLWGCQLELGSYSTSYIPTEGSSVTRVLDEADQTGVQQVIGQTEGTLYLEFVPLDASALQILFQIRTSGSTNVGQIDLRLQSGAIRTLGSDGGSTNFSFSGGSYTVGTTYKVAVRYKTNDTKLYINGSSAGSDTACSFTSSTKQQITFNENASTFPALAEIKDARLYDTALTDTELQNLTS